MFFANMNGFDKSMLVDVRGEQLGCVYGTPAAATVLDPLLSGTSLEPKA